MTYRAVPMSVVLPGLSRDDAVRVVADDGFAATLLAGPLLATSEDAPRAYLAIEPPTAPWPPLKGGRERRPRGRSTSYGCARKKAASFPSSGPTRSRGIDGVASVAVRFPAIAPAASVGRHRSHPPRLRGLHGQLPSLPHAQSRRRFPHGDPTSTFPYSPTEYMREDYLRQQVRNPQGLHQWSEAKMPSFDLKTLSDRDLDNLVAYLFYMAKRKVEVPKG
jgi:hypothetical protein